MLRVIEGTKKDISPVDYKAIYLKGMIRAIKAKELEPDNTEATKRIVFYTVKYLSIVDIKGMTRESLEGLLVFDQMLLNEICELTPAELMTIFPIKKIYDGEKYEMKDYYTTMEALKEHGLNEPIQSKVKAASLLWDYMNTTVMMYQVHCMSVVSELHSMETGKGLMEQFIEDTGLNMNSRRIHTDPDGKKFLINKDGRSTPVRKAIPRYIKLVQ